jgi:DNA polymerase kappa
VTIFSKSSRTFSPLDDTSKILKKLDEVAAELEQDMEHSGWMGRTVTLKYKLDTFQGTFRPPPFT